MGNPDLIVLQVVQVFLANSYQQLQPEISPLLDEQPEQILSVIIYSAFDNHPELHGIGVEACMRRAEHSG